MWDTGSKRGKGVSKMGREASKKMWGALKREREASKKE